MISRLRILRTDTTDPHYNLALEEMLFNAAAEGECILYLWQNRHTVVIGRTQNPWLECRTRQLEEDGGFLARRLSGGGAVYHDLGNLNFTFLVRKEDYDLSRQLSVIARACQSLGIPAEISGRNDITADGRKFSGNAFYEHQGRAYHHGTLLVDVDMAQMGRYLSPSPAKLQAKGVTSVRSRVVNLKELRPGLTIPEMAAAMEEAFSQVYGLPAEPMDASGLDREQLDALYRRNAGWEWLYGRKLPFTFQCAGKYPWGEVTIQLAAEGGIVREAAVYTDAMDGGFAPLLERAFAGCPFHTDALCRAAASLPWDEEVRGDLCALLEEQDL